MDIMSMLRLRNIFGSPPIGNDLPSQGGIMGNMNSGQVNFPSIPDFGAGPITPPNPAFDMAARMKELYSPETMATDQYNELLQQMPRREDYHPSLARGIGAGIMSLASSFGPRGNINFNPTGYKMGQEFLEEPFSNKLEDWSRQILPAQQAMVNERNMNAQSRALAGQALTQSRMADTDAMKAQLTRETNQLRMDIAEGKYTNALELAKAKSEYEEKLQQLKGQQQQDLQDMRDREIYNMIDPDDPTGQKMISTVYNPKTKKYERITLDGKNAGPVQKPAGPPKAGALNQPANLQAIRDRAQDTMEALKRVYDVEKGTIRPEVLANVGGSRMLGRQYIPGPLGTIAGETKLKNLKNKLTLELMQELKAASKSGATGFGQLNMKELAVLEDAASRLDPAMEEKDFAEAVKEIYDKLQKILMPEDGFTPGTAVTTPTFKTADEMIDYYSRPQR